MNVYIAGRLERRGELFGVAGVLEALGQKVVSTWLYADDTREAEQLDPASYAIADLNDLYRADALVAFTDPFGSLQRGGARHTEFGIALAQGKRLYVVGEPEIIFHSLAVVTRFDTAHDLIRYFVNWGIL